MKIKRGDKVVVIAGADKGKFGEVIKVDAKNEKVLVQGVHIVTKHHKPSQNNPDGRISEEEGFVHVSNVAYYDAAAKVASKLSYKMEDGVKVRFAKKTQTLVDKKKKKK